MSGLFLTYFLLDLFLFSLSSKMMNETELTQK